MRLTRAMPVFWFGASYEDHQTTTVFNNILIELVNPGFCVLDFGFENPAASLAKACSC